MRTLSVCRVLSLSRIAYMALAASFPLSAEKVLSNLLEEAGRVRGLRDLIDLSDLSDLGDLSDLRMAVWSGVR